MANTPATFKQADLLRAIRTYEKVGLSVRVVVENGKVIFEPFTPSGASDSKPAGGLDARAEFTL